MLHCVILAMCKLQYEMWIFLEIIITRLSVMLCRPGSILCVLAAGVHVCDTSVNIKT